MSVARDNPNRLKSEAALASLCGVNPLPASSGKTVRPSLNRGGRRVANNALWTIAMVRMRAMLVLKFMWSGGQMKGFRQKKFSAAEEVYF